MTLSLVVWQCHCSNCKSAECMLKATGCRGQHPHFRRSRPERGAHASGRGNSHACPLFRAVQTNRSLRIAQQCPRKQCAYARPSNWPGLGSSFQVSQCFLERLFERAKHKAPDSLPPGAIALCSADVACLMSLTSCSAANPYNCRAPLPLPCQCSRPMSDAGESSCLCPPRQRPSR